MEHLEVDLGKAAPQMASEVLATIIKGLRSGDLDVGDLDRAGTAFVVDNWAVRFDDEGRMWAAPLRSSS